jgi:hypothetical protein
MLVREQPEVQRAVEQIAAGDGYKVQRGPEEHAGRKLYLNYANSLGTADRIEIDLNYMFRVPLVPPELRQGWTPDPDFPCRARIAGLEEVMAGKLVAFLDRVAARDLYDVASFAADPPQHDAATLRRLFVGLSGILPKGLTTYSARHLESFTQKALDAELARPSSARASGWRSSCSGRGLLHCFQTSSPCPPRSENTSNVSSGASSCPNWWRPPSAVDALEQSPGTPLESRECPQAARVT